MTPWDVEKGAAEAEVRARLLRLKKVAKTIQAALLRQIEERKSQLSSTPYRGKEWPHESLRVESSPADDTSGAPRLADSLERSTSKITELPKEGTEERIRKKKGPWAWSLRHSRHVQDASLSAHQHLQEMKNAQARVLKRAAQERQQRHSKALQEMQLRCEIARQHVLDCKSLKSRRRDYEKSRTAAAAEAVSAKAARTSSAVKMQQYVQKQQAHANALARQKRHVDAQMRRRMQRRSERESGRKLAERCASAQLAAARRAEATSRKNAETILKTTGRHAKKIQFHRDQDEKRLQRLAQRMKRREEVSAKCHLRSSEEAVRRRSDNEARMQRVKVRREKQAAEKLQTKRAIAQHTARRLRDLDAAQKLQLALRLDLRGSQTALHTKMHAMLRDAKDSIEALDTFEACNTLVASITSNFEKFSTAQEQQIRAVLQNAVQKHGTTAPNAPSGVVRDVRDAGHGTPQK